jgi:hypothetical protein
LINEEPKIGAGGVQIAFIHPETTCGALIGSPCLSKKKGVVRPIRQPNDRISTNGVAPELQLSNSDKTAWRRFSVPRLPSEPYTGLISRYKMVRDERNYCEIISI